MGIIALVQTFNLRLVLARVFLTRAHFVYTNRFHKRY